MISDPYGYDDDCEGVPCPNCQDGYVECYCGGDQCYCENQGEKPCPVCFGEGEVSEEREQAYLKAERENMEAFRKAYGNYDC